MLSARVAQRLEHRCRGAFLGGRKKVTVVAAMNPPIQNPQEACVIVDETNAVVGSATRKEMREGNLIHRCSYVLVFREHVPDHALLDRGELFVQRRVKWKETYPHFFDPAPGGVVGDGESYEENARREIEEEMGVKSTELEPKLDFFYGDETSRVWGRLFSCVWPGPFALQESEVESAEWLPFRDVLELMDGDAPVCPDSAQAIRAFVKRIDETPHSIG